MTSPTGNEQQRVDVLAVMRAEIERAGGEAYPVGRTLIAARAAVAELIEVSRGLLTYRHGEYPRLGYLRDTDASRAQLDALATTLARIDGAA